MRKIEQEVGAETANGTRAARPNDEAQTTDSKPHPLNYSSSERRGSPRRRHVLVLSILVLALAGIIAMSLLPRPRVHDGSSRAKCASNLRQIGLAIMMYANEHQGHFPDRMGDLLLYEDITADAFVCPSSSDERVTAQTTQQAATRLSSEPGHLSYIYLGKGLTDKADANLLIAYERLGHHGDGCNMLFADGHVEFVPSGRAKALIIQATSRPATAETQP